jgi:hypothetical protein
VVMGLDVRAAQAFWKRKPAPEGDGTTGYTGMTFSSRSWSSWPDRVPKAARTPFLGPERRFQVAKVSLGTRFSLKTT